MIVIDTNIFFMAVYRPDSKAGLLIKAAEEGKLSLVAPDSVREEFQNLLTKKFRFTEIEAEEKIESFPIEWYNREIYISFLEKAKIMPHKPDRPLVALALLLNCGILSANTNDFKHVEKFVKVWEIDELLEEVEK